jgi:hypothetical protein
MRKTAIIITLITIASFALPAAEPAWRVELGLAGVLPADAGYRAVYGASLLAPRVEAGCDIAPELGVWASWSYASKDGTGPQSGLACHSSQHTLGCGAAYRLALGRGAELRLSAGPVLVLYKETAGDAAPSGSALGVDANVACGIALAGPLSVTARAGYTYASATNDEFASTFKLGGAWAAIGVTLRS